MSTLTGSSHSRSKPANNQSSTSLTNLIGTNEANTPIGIKIFGSCFKFGSVQSKRTYHQGLVLLLTFIAYAAFHMGRRPLSIVKNVLNRDCSKVNNSVGAQQVDSQIVSTLSTLEVTPTPNDTSCNWAPFDDNATANQLLAYLDTAFLLSYAIFMFFSGPVAERTNLRYFVSIGCVLSGLGLVAFGFSYSLDIHSMTYFIIVQIAAGAAQSTGWPVVVTCIGNWFEESKRGTIYGLWNSHTNLGNILGATIAGYFVETDWGLSFIVPGGIMVAVGILLFLFLVPAPNDVNLKAPAQEVLGNPTLTPSGDIATLSGSQYSLEIESSQKSSNVVVIESADKHEEQKGAISFMKALKIPGVIEYSLCLFFSKLVSYTFLYWLPRYITASTTFNSEDSAYLSTPFDVGGIAGAILAGYLSDKFKVNGIICNIMLIFAIPSMFVYQKYGAISSMHNILLQLVVGLLVNGPYCLITTAVSADLGYRVKDGHAMATVSAIIDGMGSVGAVLGPLFAGFVSSSNWQAVFIMLMLSDVMAALCIVRVTINDVKKLLGQSQD